MLTFQFSIALHTERCAQTNDPPFRPHTCCLFAIILFVTFVFICKINFFFQLISNIYQVCVVLKSAFVFHESFYFCHQTKKNRSKSKQTEYSMIMTVFQRSNQIFTLEQSYSIQMIVTYKKQCHFKCLTNSLKKSENKRKSQL